ncbi:unnamed protein product [Medioppia subpectinata]|uniref:Uncharacterized protein n=1 Tax=Medioppia subpectinata TaxID=1979941 RepID=A0A7R9KXW8_9ACAR|nr:unnamed protein product [Medioppia subpectinata]CAG2111899.1 unnamed protein product [Medioppia subpectinata]
MNAQPVAAITHVLFDLDGLLIDTETCYAKAYQMVAKQFGKQYTHELKVRVMGLSPKVGFEVIIKELELPITVEEFTRLGNEYFNHIVKDVELMSGAERLVRHLYDHNIPLAIASGATSDAFAIKTAKFEHFFSKNNFFKHLVIGGDDPLIARGKPFPDIFIEAMNRFDPIPETHNVLVFEDSLMGVKAALAANMPCVWVPDPVFDGSEGNATLVLKSLLDFRPEVFGLPPFESSDN